MGEVFNFVTLDGGLRKKRKKKFVFFCKNDSILKPFLFKFRFEWSVLFEQRKMCIKQA